MQAFLYARADGTKLAKSTISRGDIHLESILRFAAQTPKSCSITLANTLDTVEDDPLSASAPKHLSAT